MDSEDGTEWMWWNTKDDNRSTSTSALIGLNARVMYRAELTVEGRMWRDDGSSTSASALIGAYARVIYRARLAVNDRMQEDDGGSVSAQIPMSPSACCRNDAEGCR